MASTTMALAVIVTLSGLVQLGSCNAFLSKTNETARLSQLLNGSTIKELLLKEVSGAATDELPEIEEALKPMWLALPKNEYGNVEGSQVQYAIHRFFVQRHGWHIDGLDRVGAASGSSSSIDVMRERVSAFLMEVFEEALGSKGLSLHELAMFAATIEHLIHDEVTNRLKDVYQALEKPTSGHMSQVESNVAVDAFVMSLLMGQQKLQAPGSMTSKIERLAKIYPGWTGTQSFLRDVQNEVKDGHSEDGADVSKLSFTQVEEVVEQVSRRFGSFQDNECRHLKDTLLEAEEGTTGRVTLSDFYKKGLEANVLFKETVDYLRQQGALDESKPGQPRVIVPNFILSPGNCLADTGFYSICCISECEGILSQLERTIAAPQATPEKIVSVVQSLSSSSVQGPRVLSPRLVSQIELVAMRHGGVVPLHSRSLAQWLHVAFPHECPFPHTAASVTLTTAEMRANQASSKLSADERAKYIESAQPVAGQEEAVEAEEDLLAKWSHEEEILYMPAKQPSALWKLASAGLKTILGLGLVACTLAAVADMARRGRGVSVKGGRGMSAAGWQKEAEGKLV